MKHQEIIQFLENVGKDPSRLIFEDELTGLYNRRFLLHYFHYKVIWDALNEHPLSLIMLDADNFKEINDTYGHQVGDQALIWFSGLFRESTGEDGIAIRYAGDEFIILLPLCDKGSALKVGKCVLQRVREKPFQLDEEVLHITFSIGIASAPEDAKSGKGLIQKADTALYSAKKAGGNRLAHAGEVTLEEVFAKTAIYRLDEATIVGRSPQLAKVAQAIKKFGHGQGQFLIVEGAAGLGKSEFLETIYRNLTANKIWRVKVKALPQEMFRPYYLITNILVCLLNQRKDKGTAALESLRPKEIAYLAHILPQLGTPEKAPPREDEKMQREGIFTTLLHFVLKAVNNRPLMLFIDDFHYSDEATLMLLRQLMLRRDIPLFVCGASAESLELNAEERMVPLERFYENFHQQLGISKFSLTCLTVSEIAKYIQRLFPNVNLSEDFKNDLAQTSQGNPFFINEILRKLVLDQKMILLGQQWVLKPLEEGYLPRSLEEIVSQKIAALDEESRQLLEQVSALGEDVSLSVLTGSSGKMEAKVLDFVNQAVAQGLLSSDYELNDETVRFLSKLVLEITYGSIEYDRKQELHERIGKYQEFLYKKQLLTSAATLAYHFKRSADQERARRYEQLLATWNIKSFNAQEALNYTGEWSGEFPSAEAPLDAANLAKVPSVIRHLLSTLRNIKLYPQGSKPIVASMDQLKNTIDQILEGNDLLSFLQSEQVMVVNDQEIDVTEFKSVAQAFFKLLSRLELKGISFRKNLPKQELNILLDAFTHSTPKVIDPGFWQCFAVEHELNHIHLKQVRYTVREDSARSENSPQQQARKAPLEVVSGAADHLFDEEELAQIPEIIRSLLRATRTIRLYPLESKAVSDSIERLMEALQRILARRPFLTMILLGNSLLINGMKVDTSSFSPLADTFLRFFSSVGIKSLTFLQQVTRTELEMFIGTFGGLSDKRLDSEFWRWLAEDRSLSSILINRRFYEILNEIPAPASRQDSKSNVTEEQATEEMPEEERTELPSKQPFETFLETVPEWLPDLLLKGDEQMIQQTVERLFEGFHGREPMARQKVIAVCRNTLESLPPPGQLQLSKLLTDPLLVAISGEREPKTYTEVASLLQLMAVSLIQFGEYRPASQLFFHLQSSQRQLDDAKDKHSASPSHALRINLEPPARRLIMDDLKSSHPSRQEAAAQLLASLGEAAVPLLVDVIKEEGNYRARRIAASLLKERGPNAAELLKRELVVEISAEERLRILEIIDTLTHDLADELAYALGDENLRVRKAGFRLAERLKESFVAELLLNYATNQESILALDAIKSLGRLKMQSAVPTLLSLLNSTKQEEQLIACCRALGQIADPASIEPLTRILASKRRFLHRKRYSVQVRATAAFALAQISHPQVAQVLSPFLEDEDPRIRRIAHTVMKKIRPSSHH